MSEFGWLDEEVKTEGRQGIVSIDLSGDFVDPERLLEGGSTIPHIPYLSEEGNRLTFRVVPYTFPKMDWFIQFRCHFLQDEEERTRMVPCPGGRNCPLCKIFFRYKEIVPEGSKRIAMMGPVQKTVFYVIPRSDNYAGGAINHGNPYRLEASRSVWNKFKDLVSQAGVEILHPLRGRDMYLKRVNQFTYDLDVTGEKTPIFESQDKIIQLFTSLPPLSQFYRTEVTESDMEMLLEGAELIKAEINKAKKGATILKRPDISEAIENPGPSLDEVLADEVPEDTPVVEPPTFQETPEVSPFEDAKQQEPGKPECFGTGWKDCDKCDLCEWESQCYKLTKRGEK